VFEKLMQEAGADYSSDGLTRATTALSDTIDAYKGQTDILAVREAEEQRLTGVVVPSLQAAIGQERKVISNAHQNAAQRIVSGDGNIDECAQSYATAMHRSDVLNAALLAVGTIDIPQAYLAVLEARTELLYRRAHAVRAEALAVIIQSLQLAKPLVELNGGQLELLVNGGRVGELIKLTSQAFTDADSAKICFKEETAKQAANAAKLQVIT
jgi:hypothetical protein